MTRRILAAYVGLTALVLALLTLSLGFMFASRERDRLETKIERDARVLAAEVDDSYESGKFGPDVTALVTAYVQRTEGRVVMVNRRGESIIDSSHLGGAPRDFSTRPEIASALRGAFASGHRMSSTLGTDLLYVAVPVRHDGGVLGVVRVSYPVTTVDTAVRAIWLKLLALDAAVLGLAAMIGWLIATNLGRPIQSLETAAARLAEGDLGARVPDQRAPADLAQVSDTFNTMAERLQTLVESRQAFLADASHQLRTPLTALRLRLEAVASAQAAPSVDLDAAGAEVDRLSDLVDALLSMARIDANPGEIVPVVVGDVARERVDTWSMLADEQDVRLRLNDTTSGASARVIDGGLEQILDNLIDNALGHSGAGDTVTVRVQRARDSDRVIVAVSDEGPGVPPDQLRRLFDRFWRGPGAEPGGTGLGLSVVRRLAEASGGQATARPSQSGGLEIEVSLLAR